MVTLTHTKSNRPRLDDPRLAARIDERLAKGLAPPAEIYLVQNRNKIDWSRIPIWAQPMDPEAFDGCVHEG